MNLSEKPTGFVTMPQGTVAYWRVGTPGRAPVVCLHGGPGLPHSYLEPLARLGADREVIFYDQAGCGESGRRSPEPSWSIPYFVEELRGVVAALGLEEFHLFGNSWGGWLALEYALAAPPAAPVSLLLNSSPPSVASWISGVRELRARLPQDVVRAMDEHERAGTVHSREYRDALAVFNRRHMCRVRPWPAPLKAALGGFGDEVYAALWGTSEFGPVTGALADWDVTPRLPEIRVPTLVTCGRHDEAAPEHMAVLADGIAGARFRVFDDSSHMAFLEEPDAFIAELSAFLADVEARRR
ncbi:proline iminopeptidase-family hydrolase [Actinomadura mexicana]|uniref:Proline iminopeptidase n=1 Tax=Actinomadura mexicana TaxID=134959 RepID=A0A239A156_9ACTN|nr:proline iminopeptidase-family hydrolase [Actinomadura mexicana]SNR89031.1 tricorn interacting aminopeptidase F1. Serine peptidase. MEROPS family S33 [Actinomadura mexicana]